MLPRAAFTGQRSLLVPFPPTQHHSRSLLCHPAACEIDSPLLPPQDTSCREQSSLPSSLTSGLGPATMAVANSSVVLLLCLACLLALAECVDVAAPIANGCTSVQVCSSSSSSQPESAQHVGQPGPACGPAVL